MASSAERQARYREKHRWRLRRFEVMLPRETFATIHELAESMGYSVRETLERAVEFYRRASLSGDKGLKKGAEMRTTSVTRACEQNSQAVDDKESRPQPTPDTDREMGQAFDLIQHYKDLGIELTLRQAVQLVRQRR